MSASDRQVQPGAKTEQVCGLDATAESIPPPPFSEASSGTQKPDAFGATAESIPPPSLSSGASPLEAQKPEHSTPSPVAGLSAPVSGASFEANATPILGATDAPNEGTFIGRVLGGLYRVDSLLGEGGMGAVYAATHMHLGKSFAIKVLSEMVAENRIAVERLLQEAQAASSIDHENIIDVVSFDSTDDGRVFIVMEMLKGQSLGEMMESSGSLEVDKVLLLAFQICDALHAAHEAGIVHRDLKPENVFVTQKFRTDFVKVLDFGISKVRRAENDKVRMTQTGQLIGTPLYMSPEQSRGEETIDRRTDVYSFGVMLYEMLAGQPPFSGGNAFQLLWKHGNEVAPSLSDIAPQVPKALADVVMRTLEKDPEARPQTMAALMEELSAATGLEARNSMPSFDSLAPARLSEPPSSVSTETAQIPKKKPRLWLVALLAVAGAAIVFQLVSSGDANPETPITAQSSSGPESTSTPSEAPEIDLESSTEMVEIVETPEAVGENPPALVQIEITAEPADASITANEERLGVGSATFEAEPGSQVEFRAALRGHRSAREVVTVSEDTTRVHLRLRPRRQPTTSLVRGML